MLLRFINKKKIFIIVLVLLILSIIFLLSNFVYSTSYKNDFADQLVVEKEKPKEVVRKVSHIETPKDVKAIYMTSFVASSEKMRTPLIDFIDQSEINSVVIDIKDYTGFVSIKLSDPKLKDLAVEEVRIVDIENLIDILHSKNIYVIARVAVFQDPIFSKRRLDLAVQTKAGELWKDRKGLSWIDAGSKEYWDYMVTLSKEIYNKGFDEINFDYIRYPSDGNMKDIYYPKTLDQSKSETLASFFKYLNDNLRANGIKTSADLFGMTTSVKDDMGIGQVLEKALPYFDYIAPMIYPSHYPSGFEGFKNPASYPYEVIYKAMSDGVVRAETASSTKDKFRPWIQDFDLGADYGVTEIKAQIKALNDLGLYSYMVWSPSNRYTKEAFIKE
jgi:hypothetical protein